MRTLSAALAILALAAAAAEGAGAWTWRLPRGFPEPRVPAANPMSRAKVELGRHLFHDRRLSGNGRQSCADCHRRELAFTDGRARAVGSTGERHRRSAMSLVNVAYARTLGWASPGVEELEEQMAEPLFGREPIELGVAGREAEVEARLAADALYPGLFAAAFPDDPSPPTLERAVMAIAAFERTIVSAASPYDRLVWHGESSALSARAKRGMRLFFSDRLRCARCHGGFAFAGPVRYVGRDDPEPAFHNTGLYDVDGEGGYPPADRGLVEVTGDPADEGRFRAPTLRNVAVTGPYMHDGSVPTLAAAVDHYAAGGRTLTDGPWAGVGSLSPLKSPEMVGFALGRDERAALLAFLDALTDRELLTDPRFADPFAASGAAQRRPAPAAATLSPRP